MNNAEYWAQRFKKMEDSLKDESYEYVQNLEKQFDAAIRDIDTQIRAWYQRFATNNGISLADAKRLLTTGELKEFRWTVAEYIEKAKESGISGAWIKELENASARVHISRLDALKYQLQQQAEVLTHERVKVTTEASSVAYTQSFYHTAFEVQRGLGIGWTMQALNNNLVQKVLSRPWAVDGQTFTARCWIDKQKLVNVINQEITRMVATGAAPQKVIDAVAKQLNVSKSNASRVVMTESAFFSSAAQRDCFNELDVERYVVVCALDTNTCEKCGSLDGKVFKMSEFEVGVTANPFHPWCRCCTAPYFEDMAEIGERHARDTETGESFTVPKNTTYEQWKKMQDEKHGTGFVDKKRKMHYNESADREQYDRYKTLLGDKAPNTFEDFQSAKYSSAYSSLKVQYADARIQSRIRSGKVCTTVLAGKQGKHILGHNNFIQGKSYLNSDVDVQALVDQYAGTGTLVRDASGKWARKEVVTAGEPIGYAVSLVDGTASQTSTFTIHYSKKGVHIVPKKE